jgi:hypothetical protein
MVLKIVRHRRRALPTDRFEALKRTVLSSAFVAESTLNGPFEASRGFGVTFTAAGRGEVRARFPFFEPWLELALGEPAIRALTPWWSRRHSRIPNAWYLNLLVVGAGVEVARHVDGTLIGPTGEKGHTPECVTVLYLNVPTAPGGELQLWNGSLPVGFIKPQEGDVVHFRGDLAHAVRRFDGAQGQVRASLVIEQYHFRAEALARLPACRLESRASFSRFLEEHAQRQPKTFELER